MTIEAIKPIMMIEKTTFFTRYPHFYGYYIPWILIHQPLSLQGCPDSLNMQTVAPSLKALAKLYAR